MQNKILTASNASLKVTNLEGAADSATLNGLPLGSVEDSPTGEVALKVIAVGGEGGIPKHNNAEMTYYGSTNNLHTIVYKVGATTVRTRTFTYVNSAAADDDLLEGWVDT